MILTTLTPGSEPVSGYDSPKGFWARITGTPVSGAHPWQEVHPLFTSGGTVDWIDGQRSSTTSATPAYEISDASASDGDIVFLHFAPDRRHFLFSLGGAASPGPGNLVPIYHGPPIVELTREHIGSATVRFDWPGQSTSGGYTWNTGILIDVAPGDLLLVVIGSRTLITQQPTWATVPASVSGSASTTAVVASGVGGGDGAVVQGYLSLGAYGRGSTATSVSGAELRITFGQVANQGILAVTVTVAKLHGNIGPAFLSTVSVGGTADTGTSGSLATANIPNFGHPPALAGAILVTVGPTADTPPTWSDGWISGERVGVNEGDYLLTITHAYKLATYTTPGGVSFSGITSRPWQLNAKPTAPWI